MRKLIEKLRQKPREDRHMIATSVAGSVVAVLLCSWGVATLYSFDSSPAKTQSAAVSESVNFEPWQPIVDGTTGTISEGARYNNGYATTTSESDSPAAESTEVE